MTSRDPAAPRPRRRDGWRRALIERLEAGGRVVATSRGPVEFAEVGEGKPVLFVHGAPGGSDLGLLVARQFADPGIRWIGPSRPGYLRTPLAVGEQIEEQADMLAALLDELGVERIPVLAHSTGAAVAIHFAARYPERCAGLALAAAVARALPAARAARFAIGSLPPLITAAELPGQGSAWLLRRLGQVVARMRRDRGVPPELAVLPFLAETMLPADHRASGFVNDVRQLAALAPLPYSAIRCPVFLMHGTADLVVPLAHSRFAAQCLPGAELHLVRGGQHYAFYMPSAALKADVLAFLHRCA